MRTKEEEVVALDLRDMINLIEEGSEDIEYFNLIVGDPVIEIESNLYGGVAFANYKDFFRCFEETSLINTMQFVCETEEDIIKFTISKEDFIELKQFLEKTNVA